MLTRAGPTARRALEIFALALTLGVFILLAWRGWVLGLNSLAVREYASGILRFPIYPAKLGLALGATLTVLQVLLDLVDRLRQRSSADDAPPMV